MPTRPQQLAPIWTIFALSALFSACSGGGGGDSDAFVVRNTSVGVGGSTPIVTSGRYGAFLASEGTSGAGGTDFNGDGDTSDAIAVAIDMNGAQEFILDVAATDLVWAGSELYLRVSEAANAPSATADWNADTDTTDIVLLHWSAATNTVVYVDDLSPLGTPSMVSVGSTLFYASITQGAGANQSNIMQISSATPTTPAMVPTADNTAALFMRVVSADEGLVVLIANETIQAPARDLNGDTDNLDQVVLCLLDGTNTLGTIRCVELAMPNAASPVRAKLVDTQDWQVGFLVAEADQGATNLNDPTLFDPAWEASQCSSNDDADTTDAILHYLFFADWNTAPGTNPPTNTGLNGKERIAIANGFVATITAEADFGGCDLNGDGDTADDVVRWTQMVAQGGTILPFNDAGNIHARALVPGASGGLTEHDNRFVILVSEADDGDIDAETTIDSNLAGWLAPTTTPAAWDFTHGSTGTAFVAATWVNPRRNATRLGLSLSEELAASSLNPGTTANPGDTDLDDGIPTFADFSGSNLVFPGVGIAIDEDNAGIVTHGDFAYYRVDESEDSRDWNDDGDETDFILFRTSLSAATSTGMGALNSLTRLAVDVDLDRAPTAIAFIATESQEGAAGTDFNGDGDVTDMVVRYFSL
jgi:hypothetical protein